MSVSLFGKELNAVLPSGDLSENLCLGSAIDLTIKRTPSARAVVCGESTLTYRELDLAADATASKLLQMGLKKGARVALLMHRSEKMIMSILAILRLGCTYIPIDADNPPERVNFIVEDSGASLILVGEYVRKNSYEFNIPVLYEVDMSVDTNAEPNEYIQGSRDCESIAYIIYTSGSTGTPKGVQVSHRNVHNYVYWFRTEFGFDQSCSIDFSSTLAFDLSVTSTLVPLICGATINICSEDIKALPHLYLRYIQETAPDFIKLTPSYFGQLRRLLSSNSIDLGAMTIILGGEALVPRDVREWHARYPNHIIVNEYGPTEATVATVAYVIESDDPIVNTSNIPIGLPAYNTQIYILDGERVCEPGEIGELCIAGNSVSAGYLDRDDLNAKVFTENKFSGAGKLYRSGDLARQTETGYIQYLGRSDHQIKVRGFRIEPGEIEAILHAHESIETTAILPLTDGEGTKLAAYLQLKPGAVSNMFELRQYLNKMLPEYMIPSYFVFIDEIPLTTNGKLDRDALPLPSNIGASCDNIPPECDIEDSILSIWLSILKGKFGVTDDFFFLGGESINAAQIIYLLETEFSVQLSLQDFYKHSNVRALADFVRARLVGEIAGSEALLKALADIEEMADSEVQLQLKD